jgi:hypothetical protein
MPVKVHGMIVECLVIASRLWPMLFQLAQLVEGFVLGYIIRPYHPIVNEAAAAGDRVAINAIFDKAADATANRVAINATIVNVAAYAVAGRVAAISDEAERGA